MRFSASRTQANEGRENDMISIDADHLDHKALNDRLRGIKAPVQLTNCCGQRFIAAGMAPVSLSITGVPGNALARI